MSVPEGLTRCEVCGEFRGDVRARDLDWDGRLDAPGDPKTLVGVSCGCERTECPRCSGNEIYLPIRPVANAYDERTNGIRPVPRPSILCDACRERRAAETTDTSAHECAVSGSTESGRDACETAAPIAVLRPLVSAGDTLERGLAAGSLVYAVDVGCDRIVFIPELYARHRAALWRVLATARTWGEFERRVHPDEYRFVIDQFHWYRDVSEDDIREYMKSEGVCRDEALDSLGLPVPFPPAEEDPFDPYQIPCYAEERYPEYPTREMLLWVPEEIQERYGVPVGGMPGNDYEGLDLDPRFEEEIVARFREMGWECREDEDLVEAATCGDSASVS